MQRTTKYLRPLILAAIIATAGSSIADPHVNGAPDVVAAKSRIDSLTEQEHSESLTWDITKIGLKHRPWLDSNDALRYRIQSLRTKKTFTQEDIEEAHAILEEAIVRGTRAQEIAMKGMTLSTETREQMIRDIALLQEAERQRLDGLMGDRQFGRWVREFSRELPPANPNGGRTKRMLLGFPAVPFLYTWIWHHAEIEDKGPYAHDFENLRLFQPDKNADADILGHLAEATNEELLRLYAPELVQQIAPDADYPTEDDRIGAGTVYLTPGGEVASMIETDDPVVYTGASRVLLQGEWHRQLNYTIWYPEHPPLKPGDPEAGLTEGILIRLTLDESNHPILAETAFACGCFHRIFPVEALERAATEQYGITESGRSPLAKARMYHVDAIIPQDMGSFSEDAPHPSVYLYSGKHFVGAVEFGGYHGEPQETVTYRLSPEDSLEALPLAGNLHASFFQRDGLVRGADRPEATMLYPTGFYHAGTPRIHDNHMIHFDQYDYNDPELLEKLLRIPTLGGVLKDSNKSRYSRPTGTPSGKTVPVTEDDAPRASKKAFFCPC